MRKNRLAEQFRRVARRGEERDQRIDAEIAVMKETRTQLVAGFEARIAQIELNSERLTDLEREIVAVRAAIDAHADDTKRHTGK